MNVFSLIPKRNDRPRNGLHQIPKKAHLSQLARGNHFVVLWKQLIASSDLDLEKFEMLESKKVILRSPPYYN